MCEDKRSSALRRNCKYLLASTLVLSLTLVGTSTASAAGGYQFGAATNYSDNITRTPENGVDDVVSNLNVAGLWSNQSPRLNVSAFGQLTYLDYLNDTFDSEVVPRGNLQVDWNIIPARLSWMAEDRYGQIASDPFATFTPDNIEDINVFRTGPDFTFGASPRQLLTISLRAEDQYYEIQPADNQRLSAAVELKRRFSDSRSAALTVRAEDVEFDEPGFGNDFSVIESFVTFEQDFDGTGFSMDLGHTQLSVNNETISGVLARLSASRSIASNWYLRASGEYSYTDSGSRFLIGREQSTAGPGQTVNDDTLTAAASPLRLKHVDFNIARDAERHSVDAVFYWDLESYEFTSELDREQTGITASYQFVMNPLNTIRLSSSYRSVRFETRDRNDDNLEVELRYRRNLSANLSLDVRAARLKRSSSDPTSVFAENIVGLSLTYTSDLLDVLRSGAQ